jgi:hypothetical protein
VSPLAALCGPLATQIQSHQQLAVLAIALARRLLEEKRPTETA